MWTIWKTIPGGTRRDISDRDWLNSEFIFYNENAELVRCKVRDCLDNRRLRYTYQNVEIPWLKSKQIPRRLGKKAAETKTALTPITAFLLVLDKTIVTVVSRPKKSRSRKEKEEEDEVLVIEGIEYDNGKFEKFDVFINDDVEMPSKPENTEFAGSFVNVSHKHAKKSKTRLILGITELLVILLSSLALRLSLLKSDDYQVLGYCYYWATTCACAPTIDNVNGSCTNH
jgi:polyphenol oxidase